MMICHNCDVSLVSKCEKDEIQKCPDKVSIIIPVYNGANYLKEAIDSALAQTYKNIEIIVVNDGSIDNTDEIVKSYGNQIKYLKKTNGGVASALNYGLKVMTGGYFSWLSHDDKYYPEKIEKQINCIKNCDDNTIVISNWTMIDSNNNIIKENYIDSRLEESSACFLAFDVKTFLNGCAMLIPGIIFVKFGYFDENLKSTQDYDMWFRLSSKIKFKIIDDQLLYSRIHPNQGSFTMTDVLYNTDLIHSQIIQSLSLEEIIRYFNKNISELEEVFNSFYYNNYKQTPAHILKILIQYYIQNNEFNNASSVINRYFTKDLPIEMKDVLDDNNKLLNLYNKKMSKNISNYSRAKNYYISRTKSTFREYGLIKTVLLIIKKIYRIFLHGKLARKK